MPFKSGFYFKLLAAYANDVAGFNQVFLDSFAVDVGTIGAVEILDVGGIKIGIDPGMLAADSGVIEQNIILPGTANRYPTSTKWE